MIPKNNNKLYGTQKEFKLNGNLLKKRVNVGQNSSSDMKHKSVMYVALNCYRKKL